MTLLFHCMLCERDKFQLHMYMFLYTCSNSELIRILFDIYYTVCHVRVLHACFVAECEHAGIWYNARSLQQLKVMPSIFFSLTYIDHTSLINTFTIIKKHVSYLLQRVIINLSSGQYNINT